jgi:type IV pilus assembly protein PilM
MADQQSIIALNIGSQRISMGVLAPTKKGLILKKYAATTILADPATEAARIPQVKLAIKELAKGLKVDKQKAAYALSGQSVFVRFVKLPKGIEEEMDDLVRFEAQQNVPFPLDEVVWDWEKLETDGIEQEVVLVAIKADSLNDLNSVVADTGLGTRLVDSAPTALYNSFRYNYPGLEECVLLLDIGAKTSNLIYADGKKFFTRSVSIGGANITSAIAKEYNVSFVDAENSKITNGLVTLGGAHADQLDDATAALGTVVRNALARLTAEIQRTNTLFRSQQGGNAPQKVLLAGGTTNLPYLREFLEEKLNLPVETFNPLQRISVGKGVDVDAIGQEAHQLGELVGLSLRATEKSEVSIDLVPDAVQAQRDISRRKPALITAAALFIVGLGLWAGFKTISVSDGKAHLASLELKAREIQQPASKIKRLLKDEKKNLDLINAYAAAESGRLSFINTWNDVSKAFVSENVWVTDFEYRTKYQIDGDAKSDPVMDESFATATYGNSPLMKEETWVDSVSISGLHLNKQAEVLDILEELKKSGVLKFVDAKDNPIPDNQLAQITAAPAEETNDYAAPFKMLVPLKQPFQHK